MLKERENELDVLQEHLVDEAPIGDSIPSPESMSIGSSGLDSGRREVGVKHMDSEMELDGDEHEDDLDEADVADHRRFERLIQEKMDIPTSDNGLYLARTVAPVLTKALAEVLLRRPADPIDFISEWLIHYNGKDTNNHHL